MDKKSSYTIPLEELLALIKASGYELSIQQILDIQVALLTVPVLRLKPDRLKHLITPVIAKNDEEQRHLHHIIDAYVAEKTKIVALPIHPFTRWRQEHKQLLFALKIAGFMAVVITGILFYLASHNKTPNALPSKRVAEIKRDSNTAATPAPAKQPVNPALISTVPVKTAKPVDIITEASGRSIIPEPIDFNLQMSGVFGTIMGIILAWIIFYERKRKMDMKEKRRADDAIFVKRTENKKRSAGSGFEPSGEMAQPTVQFAERDYLVHQPRTLQKIKSHLKRPAAVQNPGFDIKRSIAKSARSAGFTSLVYTSEWKDRKYLILTDNQHSGSHLTCLLNYVMNSISAAVTTVARYNYIGGLVQDETGNWLSLENLAFQYKGYHLIIIGNGYSFFDKESEVLKKELTDIFQTWPSRSIITPTPLPDWSHPEEQLQKSKFQLVPADMDAMELLAKAIAEDTTVSTQQLFKRLPNAYSIAANNFQSVQELKQYLNDERLFQLVCALAVYPRLQWALTLALFDALLKNNTPYEPTAELSFELLLKVARIPWLHADRFDDKIRLELLNALTVETETTARETILTMLNEARPNTVHDSPAFTELNTQYNINAFFLFTFDQYKYRQYADAKEVINDYWKDLTEWALKEHVDNSGSTLMPKYRSRQSSVQEFLLQEKQFDKWNINFLKVALLTLPAILLYILFALIKPAFVYPPQLYKNVSFATIIKKENNCIQQLNYVINSTNGRSDTIVLNQLYHTDTIPLIDVKYNETINLEIWTKDSLMHPVSFAAMDSFFAVSARCK